MSESIRFSAGADRIVVVVDGPESAGVIDGVRTVMVPYEGTTSRQSLEEAQGAIVDYLEGIGCLVRTDSRTLSRPGSISAHYWINAATPVLTKPLREEGA